MKKTVPFEIFGANQYLMFDLIRLAALERVLGKSIPNVIASGDIGVDVVLKSLPIAMQQHYFNKPVEFWADLVEKYIDEGGSLDEIAVPIVRAIMVSGVLGSAVRDRVIEQMEKLAGNDGEEPKNEPGTEIPSKPLKRGSTGPKQ